MTLLVLPVWHQVLFNVWRLDLFSFNKELNQSKSKKKRQQKAKKENTPQTYLSYGPPFKLLQGKLKFLQVYPDAFQWHRAGQLVSFQTHPSTDPPSLSKRHPRDFDGSKPKISEAIGEKKKGGQEAKESVAEAQKSPSAREHLASCSPKL